MNATTDSELEVALRRVFEEQARSVEARPASYGEARLDTAAPVRRRPLGAFVGLAAAAAVVALVVGVVVVTRAEAPSTVKARGSKTPTSVVVTPPNPVHWATPQVHLDADDFGIEVGGRRFTGTVPHVGVTSDPGDATYQTLELEWWEHGVEMRWYIYFASDGHDWWATEMRTYNGAPGTNGEWVTFKGTQFRSPLGSTFSGNLNLTATEGGYTSHLYAHGLRLRAFVNRPAA
jgi:hypothetical protein